MSWRTSSKINAGKANSARLVDERQQENTDAEYAQDELRNRREQVAYEDAARGPRRASPISAVRALLVYVGFTCCTRGLITPLEIFSQEYATDGSQYEPEESADTDKQ